MLASPVGVANLSRSMQPLPRFLAVAFVAAVLPAQATLLVPTDYPTIQSALDAAASGDTVRVAPGVYPEHLSFPGRDIWLLGAGPAVTTIQGSQFLPVVDFAPGSTRLALLEGFTITGGYGFQGGGILVRSAAPTIRGNVIRNNRASAWGCGIHCQFASPRIERNRIADNFQPQAQGGGGGGIAVVGASSVEIIDNVVEDNQHRSGGGAIDLFAAGTPRIVGNLIRRNTAPDGGAIRFANDSAALVLQNLIVGNSASRGGAIHHTNGAARFVANTIADNTAGQGAAVYALRPIAVLTFVGNILSAPGGTVLYGDLWRPEVTHVFRHNDVFGAVGYGGNWPNWHGSNGNFAADPAFRGAGDYRLAWGSPCRDTGEAHPELPPRDFFGDPRVAGAAVDVGADEFAGLFPFGTGCAGSDGVEPVLVADLGGLPELGNAAFAFGLEQGPADGLAWLCIGDSNTAWNGAPLPAGLGAFGLPHCALRVAVLHAAPRVVEAAGTADAGCPVPAVPALAGAVLHAQWLTAAVVGGGARLDAATAAVTIELF